MCKIIHEKLECVIKTRRFPGFVFFNFGLIIIYAQLELRLSDSANEIYKGLSAYGTFLHMLHI